MAITKQKKETLVEEVGTLLTTAASIVFVKFEKLPVQETISFRRELRTQSVGYKVLKKTLLKRVLDTKGISGILPELPGEIAIAYGDDLLAPARGVLGFSKTHAQQVSIVGGVFEGVYMDKVQMESIAKIPPREVLLAQIAYLLKSPITRLAVGINEVAKKK